LLEIVKLHRTGDHTEDRLITTETNLVDKYKILLYIFGPAIVGMAKWACADNVTLLSKVLTATDKAFIIVTILNYVERWEVVMAKWAARCKPTAVTSMMQCVVCADILITSFTNNPFVNRLRRGTQAMVALIGHHYWQQGTLMPITDHGLKSQRGKFRSTVCRFWG
jgi:hypothetical protein